MLKKRVELFLKIVSVLTTEPKKRDEIAREIGISSSYIDMVLRAMRRNGIIGAKNGKQGGIYIADENLASTPIKDIYVMLYNEQPTYDVAMAVGDFLNQDN